MKYDYARVSTDDQNSALQLEAVKGAGCAKVFKDEGISGATTKRPSLVRCLKTLKHGDTLTVWKLDRLGRSLRDLITEIIEAQSQLQLTRLRSRWMRYDLVVLDELGYVVMPDAAAELLFQVIAGRAEQAAIIMTTNPPFSEWPSNIPVSVNL